MFLTSSSPAKTWVKLTKCSDVISSPTVQGMRVAETLFALAQRKTRCWEAAEATTWWRVKAMAESSSSDTVVERLESM